MLWGSTYVKAEVRAHHRPFATLGPLASAPKQFVRVCASLRGSGFTSPFGLAHGFTYTPSIHQQLLRGHPHRPTVGKTNGERGIRDGMLRTMQHRQECGTRVRRWRKLEPVCRALGVPALQAEELASSAKRLFERCHICAAQHPPCMRAVRRCCFPPRLLASQRAPCCPPNRGASLDLHTC